MEEIAADFIREIVHGVTLTQGNKMHKDGGVLQRGLAARIGHCCGMLLLLLLHTVLPVAECVQTDSRMPLLQVRSASECADQMNNEADLDQSNATVSEQLHLVVTRLGCADRHSSGDHR